MTEPLVSVEDFVTITCSAAPTAQIRALLAQASSAVLAEARGQQIVAGTSTDVTVRNYEGVFYLPQRPVTAITSVVVNDAELVENVDYRWTPGGNRRPAMIIRQVDGLDVLFDSATATVTYSHGWAELPGQISAAIVAMVANSIATNSGTTVLTGTTIGPFSESYAASVPPNVKDVVDHVCGVDRDTSVPIMVA